MTRDQILEIFVQVVGRQPGHNDQQTINDLTTMHHLTVEQIEDFLRSMATPPPPDPLPKPKTPPAPVASPKPVKTTPPVIIPPPLEPDPEISDEPEEPVDDEEPETEELTKDDLKNMKVKELKILAKELGIKGKFNKKQLIDKIWNKMD